MKDTLSSFLNYLENELKYSENTCISYKNDIHLFNKYLSLENISLVDVDYFTIRYYIVYLSKNDYSKNSIRRNLSALSTYFEYLVNNQFVESNPVKIVDGVKKDKHLPEFLYLEEIMEIYNACNKSRYESRDKLIVALLFYNGLRVSELTNIKLYDIASNRLKVFGKGKKERYLVLNKNVVNLINQYINIERKELLKCETDYLLINNKGTPLTSRGVRYIIKSICDNSSLDKNVYPHMLRHSFATYFLANGSDLLTVQTFLGHENISTTQIYTHLSDSQLEDAYKSFHPRGNKKTKDE